MNISLRLDPPRDAQQALLAVERVVVRSRPGRGITFDRLVAGAVEVAFEHAQHPPPYAAIILRYSPDYLEEVVFSEARITQQRSRDHKDTQFA